MCEEIKGFPYLMLVVKHQIYFTNVLVLEALPYTTTPQEPRFIFFFFPGSGKNSVCFSQSISDLMRNSSANLLHWSPPTQHAACAVLHLCTPLATDDFPLCTTFRHPLTSSAPPLAVLQTHLLLISLCSRRHFWLSCINNKHNVWYGKQNCPTNVLNHKSRM